MTEPEAAVTLETIATTYAAAAMEFDLERECD